jgi:hypothetical protein
MSELMKCNTCEENFNPANLSEVFLHEHKGIWLREKYSGRLSGISFTEKECSNIKSLQYLTESSDMDVTMHNDNRFRYFEVPFEIFEQVAKADSVGSMFNRLIKGTYRYCYMNDL